MEIKIKLILKKIISYLLKLPENRDEEYLHTIFHPLTRISFIQIGSNDGKNGDPLRRYITKNDWNGILIEPVKYIFDRLKDNYKEQKDRLIFINKAIGKNNTSLKFYRLRESDNSDLPNWYDQLGTFDKKTLLRHKDSIENFDDLLIEDRVEVADFKEIIDSYQYQHVDLIHIDTEGYDLEIIKLIPFEIIRPKIILFERKHLSKFDYLTACFLLRKQKFKLVNINGDTLAIRN